MKVALRIYIEKKLVTLNDFLLENLGFNLHYLTQNGSWLLLQQICASLISFGSVLLFARYLSRDTYGQFLYVNSMFTLLGITTIPGLLPSVARSVALGYEGSLLQAFKYRFIYSFIGIFLFFLIAFYYYHIEDVVLGNTFLVVSVFTPFLYTTEVWRGYLKGKAHFEQLAKRLIIINVSSFVVLVWILFYFSDQLILLVSANFLITSIFNILFFLQAKKKTSNHETSKETLTYGWFMTKMKALGTIVYQMDRVIIGFLSIDILSTFAIAQRMVEVIESILSGPIKITFPRFVTQQSKFISSKLILALFFLGMLIGIPLIFLSKAIIVFLFTNKYAGSIWMFQVLSIGIPFALVASIFKQKIEAKKRERALFQIHFSIPFISLVTGVLAYLYTSSIHWFFFIKVLTIKFLEAFYLVYYDRTS